jgi:hypothetical protein
MKILLLLSPLLFTLAAVLLTAVESTFFSHLGIPAALTPDLNLALIIFLSSCGPDTKTILSALGVSLAASLFGSSPGFPLFMGPLLLFFIGLRLNQTMFMNHIFPQAVFTGLGRALLTLGGILAGAAGDHILLQALAGFISTTIFALPLLLLLNHLRDRFLPQAANLLSTP